MQHLVFRSRLDVPATDLFAWHTREGAFERLTPPWAPVRLEHFEGIRDGDRAVLRIGPGPFGLKWVAEHFDYVEGQQFCDRQVQGPFGLWRHRHRMEEAGDAASVLVDDLRFEPPLGELGQLGVPLIRRELRRMFAYRHRITRQDLDLHRRYNPDGRRLRVAISGSSGLIGTNLRAFLTTGGHEVLKLVRHEPRHADEIRWNPATATVDAERLAGLDAVIHLAGENVFAVRWTPEKKKAIYDSRIAGTRLLAEAMAGLDDPPKAFLCASATGYYGSRGSERLTEDAPPDPNGFLAHVVEDWEAATEPAAEAGIRTAMLRTSVVLTPAGGALQLMLPPFWLGLGGWIGRPEQYLSWVALDDVIGAYYHVLMTDELEGPVNLTAPEPVTMRTYARTLADVLRRPAFLNVPGEAVRAVMGEAGEETILQDVRVVPERLEATDYAFQYPTLEGALRHQLGRGLHQPIG